MMSTLRGSILLALLGAAGCANTAVTSKAPEKPRGAPLIAQASALERARVAGAQAVHASAAHVEAEVIEDANAPGVVPFRSHIRTDEGGTNGHRSGVLLAEEAIVDRARAVAALMAAWRYDDKRPVAAREVARVVGFLMSDFATTRPFLEAADYEAIRPEYKKLLAPPRELVVGGAPAVEFWMSAASDADLGPPLYRVQVVVPPGGEARLSMKQISEFEE